jgi:hypothetical protein
VKVTRSIQRCALDRKLNPYVSVLGAAQQTGPTQA